MKRCDIIMPAYNSEDVLPYAIKALQEQAIPAGWVVRLVVGDDGSSDATKNICENTAFPSGWKPPLVVSGKHEGVSAARNKAISASDAGIIMLLGADIVLAPNALAAHLLFHEKHTSLREAALGMVRWDPRVQPTPFMEWMMHGGQQNDFDSLLGVDRADPGHFFYGSHLSIKREMMQKAPFAPYGRYGWEDFDAGRRLAGNGLVLRVLHGAVGMHRHFYTSKKIVERQRAIGAGISEYARRFPEQAIAPPLTGKRKMKILLARLTGIKALCSIVVRIFGETYTLPRLFLAATAMEFWDARLKTET